MSPMSSIDVRGLAAARYCKAVFAGNGVNDAALAYAASQDWRDSPATYAVIKAEVSGHTTANSAGLLGPVGVDFSEYVRPLSLLGRIAGMRHVPPRTRLITGTGGTSAHFIGEASPKPLSKATFENMMLEPLKVAAITVVTNELLRHSTPKADQALLQDMAAASAAAMDAAFISPGNAGVLNVKPASISSGVAPHLSSGSSGTQVESDLKLMLQDLIDAGSDMQNLVWVLSPSTALFIGTIRDAGGLLFPGLTVKGGTLLGVDAFTSPHLAGDSAGGSIVLFDPTVVAVADEDEVEIAVVKQASVQMADDPSISGTSVLVSLWQLNCAGIRVERLVNWRLRQQNFVSVLSVGY